MSVNRFKNGVLQKIAGAVGDAVPLINNFLTNQPGKGAADANTVYQLKNEIDSVNDSLGSYELLLETNSTSPTEYTVKDITHFKEISVMSFYPSGILGNVRIPVSLFTTLGGVVQSGFGTAYVSLVTYVSNTKISAYVGGTNASNTTCKVYGIK